MVEAHRLFLVRIWKHPIANRRREVVASRDELAKSPPGWAERIELIRRETVFGVGALEIREFQQKLIHNSGIDGFVDPRDDFDITRIETNLPRRWMRLGEILAERGGFCPSILRNSQWRW